MQTETVEAEVGWRLMQVVEACEVTEGHFRHVCQG